MADLIKANGEIVRVEPENGSDFSLKELQGYVGGYIEVIRLTPDEIMVVNEVGRMMGLPVNGRASDLYEADVIVGDVILCDVSEVR